MARNLRHYIRGQWWKQISHVSPAISHDPLHMQYMHQVQYFDKLEYAPMRRSIFNDKINTAYGNKKMSFQMTSFKEILNYSKLRNSWLNSKR